LGPGKAHGRNCKCQTTLKEYRRTSISGTKESTDNLPA
jgi:hypothetical protein